MALNLQKKTILIVDDVREMRVSLRSIVRSMGAENIYEAKSGDEAIERLQTFPIDIVLCDYNLGDGRDGQQVFEEAKEFGMLAPHTAFIMITADNTVGVVMAVVEHHPDDYIVKPLSRPVIESRLEKVLLRKHVFKDIEAQMAVSEYTNAAAMCDITLSRHPKMRFDLLRVKVEALLRAGDAEAAAEVCAGVIMEREVPWAVICMGRARYLVGDLNKARSLFQKAIELNDASMEAYDWLVRLDREAGNLEAAQSTLQQAAKLSPKSIGRQQHLADLATTNGDHETARKAFQAAVDLGLYSCFSRIDDQVGLVNAVAETEGPEAALKVLDKLNDRTNRLRTGTQVEPDWRLSLSQARLLMINQRAADAKKVVEKSTKIFFSQARDTADPAVIELARLCYAVGMIEQAKKFVDRIVRENHDRQDVIDAVQAMFDDLGMREQGSDLIDTARRAVIEINNRGVGLAKQGDLEEAVELLTRASDELPGNLTIVLNVLHAILGQIKKAGYTNHRQYLISEYLQRAEQIGTNNEKLARMREKILQVQQAARQGVVA